MITAAIRRLHVSAVVALLALPAAAAAQSSASADSLDALATVREDHHHLSRDLVVPAAMRERAAALRPATDVAGIRSLRLAAFDWYYAGRTDRAGRLMEASARRAERAGDLALAAQAYLDAARIASERAQPIRARKLVACATALSATAARRLAGRE